MFLESLNHGDTVTSEKNTNRRHISVYAEK